MKNIGNRLKQIRSERNKSQKDLAALLGIPFRTLQDCERGKTLPSATTLAAYSAIGVDLNWVITGRDDHADNPTKLIEKAVAGSKNTVSDELIPIPWFAANDIRKSYLVDEEFKYQTARIAMHKSEVSRLGRRKTNNPTGQSQLATTTMPCSDTSGLKEICGFVLFDLLDIEPNVPGYFVCVEDGLLLVKRLQLLQDGLMITLGLQNATSIAIKPKSTRIIGRVVGNI